MIGDKVLLTDMTHGGVLLAQKLMGDYQVYAYDMYHTLASDDIIFLEDDLGVIIVDDIDLFLNDNPGVRVISPVHSPVKGDETYHSIIGELLSGDKMVPVVEVTGVKGKTTVVELLKGLLGDCDPLVLSSLGVKVLNDGEEFLLEGDISIAPVNILCALDLAKKYDFGLCLFELSLGGTGLADLGVITNIVEDYSIAQGASSASIAKSQIFKSKIVVIEFESFSNFYSNISHGRINTFSVESNKANLYVRKVEYGDLSSHIIIDYNNLKTLTGNISGSLEIDTYAPGEYYLSNILCTITTALSLKNTPQQITKKLKNTPQIPGRSSQKKINNYTTITEEINPGLNTQAIKKAIQTINKKENPITILGGQYGITCEEINEKQLTTTLKQLIQHDKTKIILTDQLGKNLKKHLPTNIPYYHHPETAKQKAIQNKYKNILFIYRSQYKELEKR